MHHTTTPRADHRSAPDPGGDVAGHRRNHRRGRRLGTLMGAGLLAAGLGAGAAATPAAAADVPHRVDLSGSIFIHDDDLWPNPDDNGTHTFAGSVTVGGSTFFKIFETEGCVGGEVRGELRVIVEDHVGDWVKVRVRGRLYERESCDNTDLDGDSGEKSYWVREGQSLTIPTLRVHNGEPGDGGYNDYRLTIRNRLP